MSAFEPPRTGRRLVAGSVALALSYAVLAAIGLQWSTVAGAASPVFPAAGVALSGLVIGGPRMWPVVFAAVLGVGALSASPLPWWAWAVIAGGQSLSPMIAVVALRRAGFDAGFPRTRDAAAFVLIGAAGASGLAALCGAATLRAALGHDLPATFDAWVNWFVGDVVGNLTVAPFVLAARTSIRREPRWWLGLAVCVAVTFAVGWLVFLANASRLPVSWYAIVPMVGAAFVSGMHGTAATLVVSTLAVAGTSLGNGPFSGIERSMTFPLLQQFVACGASASLVVAALAAELRGREALRRSEQRFRSLATATAEAVWTCGPDGRVVDASPSWCAFTGQAIAQALGHGWIDAVHAEDRATALLRWHDAVTRQTAYEHELRVRRADGEYRWVAARAVPVRSRAGRVEEWVGTTTDVTERRRTADALVEADRRKDEFLATLAHELRNPLAPIRTGLKLLDRAADGDAARAARRMMERQVVYMVRLVDDLLDVSRISLGKLALRRSRVQVDAIAERAIEQSRHAIERSRQRLIVERPPQAVWLHADADRLAQVLGNLLANASRYTPAGGTIVLAWERVRDELKLRVSDDGQGIAPHVLGRIFELFAQGDSTHDGRDDGLGIGLALARQLVELHGGSIAARSDGQDRGSTFTIRLPLPAARAADAGSEADVREAA
jgi:PAS domain S-box-containing protein